MKKRDDKPAITPDKRTRILVYCLVAVVTLTLYWQVWDFGFITMDDEPYVTGNPWVQLGLDVRTVTWAFTRWDFNTANWHPLTWLSHAADVSIHGSDAGGHHFTSVMFHTTNSLLLLLALTLMTGNFWRSAIVAALFAVHPQHVESVAWVSERKDVLSTFFLILTLLSYTSYARKPSTKRMALVTTALALGLMSKPMLVSVPLLLLLLDYWPLRRAARDKPWEEAWRPLVIEKWPLLALAAGSCAVTFLAQRSAGAIVTSHPVGVRLANAVTSCVNYVMKTFWPTDLAMYYPPPRNEHADVACGSRRRGTAGGNTHGSKAGQESALSYGRMAVVLDIARSCNWHCPSRLTRNGGQIHIRTAYRAVRSGRLGYRGSGRP